MHSVPDFPISVPVMIAWILCLVVAVAGYINLLIFLNRKGHRRIIGLIFVLLLVAGTAIHIWLLSRSTHTVTDGNWIQLGMVSMIAALEMFIGHSVVFDDIIAAVIFREPLLLLLYVTVFAFAVVYTLSIVLLIMPRRLRDRTWLAMNRYKVRKGQKNHIFLGLNAHSKVLAQTILAGWEKEKDRKDQGELILVDFPSSDARHKEISIGELFTNIFGRQKEISLEDELQSTRFVLLRGHMPEGESTTLCKAIGLEKLHSWLESPNTTLYILSPDEEDNFSILKLLVTDPSIKSKIFCYTKRVNSYTSLLSAMGDRIHLLNPPEMTFMELKKNSPQLHPVHFADVARSADGKPLGYVNSGSSALLIGFGETGQEALRYLFEFGSFIGKDLAPVQNTYYVYDPQIHSIKGDFLNRTPALRYGANINWSSVTAGSSQFWLEYAMMLPSLSYAIICADKGHQNVEIAVRLLKEAVRYGKDLSHLCILVRAWEADAQMEELIDFYNKSFCPEGVRVIHPFGLPHKLWNLDVITGKGLKYQSVQYAKLNQDESWEERSARIRTRGGNELLNRQELLRKQAGDISRALFSHTLLQLCPPQAYSLAENIPDTLDPEHPVHYSGKKADARLLEYLAVGEHFHWMTQLEAAGYIDGGDTQDELNKKIAHLVPYDLLPSEEARHLSWLAVKAALLSQNPVNEQNNG